MVIRFVRMIFSFYCFLKEEKFCGFKYVEIMSGRLNILVKRKCEYNIVKNNFFLSVLFFFWKLVVWGCFEKNNGGVIDVYF